MAPTKSPDLIRVMHVVPRDVEIYKAVMVGNRTQKAVALEHNLTQPRVSKIIARVERWLSQPEAEGFHELYRSERLRTVARVHKMRLEYLYHEALNAWEDSRKATHKAKTRQVKGESSEEREVRLQSGDRRHWQDAVLAANMLTEFEGFDRRGNVDISCKGRVPEVPEMKPIDAYRELKKRTMKGQFDTPGDEGIPGAWGQEMRVTNARLEMEREEDGDRESGVGGQGKGVGDQGTGVGDQGKGAGREVRQSDSLAPVLRGEGRGEGLAVQMREGLEECGRDCGTGPSPQPSPRSTEERECVALNPDSCFPTPDSCTPSPDSHTPQASPGISQEYPSHNSGITTDFDGNLRHTKGIKEAKVEYKNDVTSAQVDQEQPLTPKTIVPGVLYSDAPFVGLPGRTKLPLGHKLLPGQTVGREFPPAAKDRLPCSHRDPTPR